MSSVQSLRPHPLVLIILDGWGEREEIKDNAIAAAHKPCWDKLWRDYPHSLLSGSGRCVGLPEGQMGNSEVGHMNMGAGRIIPQDLTRIDQAIEDGSFFSNSVLLQTLQKLKASGKALHMMGLLSPGGVHSQESHFLAMLTMAAKVGLSKIYLHGFLDGRDTPPQSAAQSLRAVEAKIKSLGVGRLATLIGRYYAMDRDKRWERTQKAYELLTQGRAEFSAKDAVSALEEAYARGEGDEFVQATRIGELDDYPGMIDGDAVIFMNFRADRARQLTQAFIDPALKGFQREVQPKLDFVSLTQYDQNYPIPCAFPPIPLRHILPEYLAELGLKQLRIAETEKYAHVTYFFNGGVEQAFPGEERVLIPSPKVATYDLQPEMSAPALSDRLVEEIHSGRFDVIVCNFANPDMVGHSGDFAATVKAIECVDHCLDKVLRALKAVGGEALITADHGNAEMMYDHETCQPHTAHTLELVPALYIGREATVAKPKGTLADVAPTLLYLLGLPVPVEMKGEILFTLK